MLEKWGTRDEEMLPGAFCECIRCVALYRRRADHLLLECRDDAQKRSIVMLAWSNGRHGEAIDSILCARCREYVFRRHFSQGQIQTDLRKRGLSWLARAMCLRAGINPTKDSVERVQVLLDDKTARQIPLFLTNKRAQGELRNCSIFFRGECSMRNVSTGGKSSNGGLSGDGHQYISPAEQASIVSAAREFLVGGGDVSDEDEFRQFLSDHLKDDRFSARGVSLAECGIDPARLNGQAEEALIRARIDMLTDEWANHSMWWDPAQTCQQVTADGYLQRHGVDANTVASRREYMTACISAHSRPLK